MIRRDCLRATEFRRRGPSGMDADLPALMRHAIAWYVMPLWIAASFGDWLAHRRCDIEHTSGWRESVLHGLMVAELGPPTVAAALCEINAAVILWLLAGFAAHHLTVYADLKFSSARRDIPPVEQMIHSVLEFAPVIGGVLVMLLHPQAVASLWPGGEPADFSLRWKEQPLPLPLLAGYAIAIGAFTILPLAAEFVGCVRAARLTSSRGPT